MSNIMDRLHNCPNCGAPMKQNDYCEYCGAHVEPINLKCWKILSKIYIIIDNKILIYIQNLRYLIGVKIQKKNNYLGNISIPSYIIILGKYCLLTSISYIVVIIL